MLTPDGKSSFIKASTVFGVGFTMSIRRLCVRISNCSRESLYLCVARMIVYRLRSVGNGIGPEIVAPVLFAVSTILSADWSKIRCSYAFKRIRIYSYAIYFTSFVYFEK
jgi:hypothetical protein